MAWKTPILQEFKSSKETPPTNAVPDVDNISNFHTSIITTVKFCYLYAKMVMKIF